MRDVQRLALNVRVIRQSQLSVLVDTPGEELHFSGGLVLTQYIDNLLADLHVFYEIIVESIELHEFWEVS
jgi:hypothetical protein